MTAAYVRAKDLVIQRRCRATSPARMARKPRAVAASQLMASPRKPAPATGPLWENIAINPPETPPTRQATT